MSLKKPTDSEAEAEMVEDVLFYPNQMTRETLERSEAGIDVFKASDADDLFEKIEIADTEKPKPKRKLGLLKDSPHRPRFLNLDDEAAAKLEAELDREVLKLFYPEDYEDEDTES
jgi:ABC-type iron transport system FetAB ATPase subunit